MPRGNIKHRLAERLRLWLHRVRMWGNKHVLDTAACDAPECRSINELLAENKELKERIEHLHALNFGHSSVTDRSLTNEVNSLKIIVKEQEAKLGRASRTLKDLFPYRNLYREIKVERDLLVARLEHQGKLLRCMMNENPKQKDSISKVEGLIQENQRLRTELVKSSDLLDQLRTYLPANYQQRIEELVKRNLLLIGDLDEKGVQLEAVLAGSDGNLMDYFNRLSEENVHLKRIKESREFIDHYIASQGEIGDPEELIEILNVENQRMELSLGDREEQIGYLSEGAPNHGLLNAYTNLRKDYRQLFLENQHKDQIYCDREEGKQGLHAQVRGKTALIKANNRLEIELKSCNETWSNRLKKAEGRMELLEITNSAIEAKYANALAENQNLHRELKILKDEHEMVMKQLGTAFGDQRSSV